MKQILKLFKFSNIKLASKNDSPNNAVFVQVGYYWKLLLYEITITSKLF